MIILIILIFNPYSKGNTVLIVLQKNYISALNRLNIYSNIQRIEILNYDTLFDDCLVISGIQIQFQVQIFDINNQLLSNSDINPLVRIYTIPESYFYLTIFDNFQKVFQNKFQVQAGKTDLNGISNVLFVLNRITLPKDFPGNWTFGLEYQGRFSFPIKVCQNLLLDSISFINDFNLFNSKNYSLFEYIQPTIHLKITGQSINNISVITKLYNNDPSILIDLNGYQDKNFVWNPGRISYLELPNQVSFSKLTVLSYNSSDCVSVSFVFEVIATIPPLKSNNTPPVTFCRTFTMEDVPFTNHEIVHFEEITSFSISLDLFYSPYLLTDFIPFSSHIEINKIFEEDLNYFYMKTVSKAFLANYECIFIHNTMVDNVNCGSSFYNIDAINLTQIVFNFLGAYWNSYSQTDRFEFLPCIFNFCNFSMNDFSGIKISGIAAYLEFWNPLPETMIIDNTYYVWLYAEKAGSPCPYSRVYCNISVFDDSLKSQLFGNYSSSNDSRTSGNNY